MNLNGQIVQDADRLDAIGAIGIARCMVYSGSKNRIIHNPECLNKVKLLSANEYLRNERTAIEHFYEKLLHLKDLMNTETTKRHEFMLTFLDEFYQEWDGLI